MKLRVGSSERGYDIILERGALGRLGEYLALDRRALVVTDEGVPKQYVRTVLAQLPDGALFTVPQGEGAKSFAVLERVCGELLARKFSRCDLLLALGGGVVGDLTGFAAACYLRGIDYAGIPTTTLSQIDSSVGGKTAINLNGVKNCVGVFHPPCCVIADGDTLATLPERHFANGLAEAVKAGLIADPALFELLEQEDARERIDEIIARSLAVKKRVVEADETERGPRRILNFGHTIGHGVESVYGLAGGKPGGLLHGEAVAVGMLPMIENPALRERVRAVFRRLGLDVDMSYDADAVYEVMTRDKKTHGAAITLAIVPELGACELREVPIEALRDYLKR